MSDRFTDLEFVHINSECEAVDFVSSVNRALDDRKCGYGEKFLVRFKYCSAFASDVDSWVDLCVKNAVKNFTLAIDSQRKNYYPLFQIIYSSSVFTTLHLEGCIMFAETTIGWQSLTRLCLKDVVLNQSTIDDLLFGCPVLLDLALQGCRGFDRLEVNSASVDTLKIEESEDETSLEISAPYVCTLDITVFPQRRTLLLKNISSVVAGFINLFECDFGTTSELVMRNAKEFLENFNHVKKVYLARQCFEVVSMMVVNGMQLPQFSQENLTVVSCTEYGHCISGIFGLLESSPNLETLVLQGYATEKEIVNLDPAAAERDLDGDLFHLKTVKFDNFTNRFGEPLLTLAKILLKRASALKEMVIETDIPDMKDIMKIIASLLNYPRSSAKAAVRFYRK